MVGSRLTSTSGLLLPASVVFRHGGIGYRIDIKRTLRLNVRLLSDGAHGLVINGGTGDILNTPHKEKLRWIEAVGSAKVAPGVREDAILITGLCTTDEREMQEIVDAACEHGFEALLVLPPRGDYSIKLTYFRRLAEMCAGRIAIILYNHPKLDKSFWVTPQLLAELMRDYDCIIGLKDSAGDLQLLASWKPRVKELCGREPFVAIGEDTLISEAITKGWATAAISGSANSHDAFSILTSMFILFEKEDAAAMHELQVRLNQEVKILLRNNNFKGNCKRRLYRGQLHKGHVSTSD